MVYDATPVCQANVATYTMRDLDLSRAHKSQDKMAEGGRGGGNRRGKNSPAVTINVREIRCNLALCIPGRGANPRGSQVQQNAGAAASASPLGRILPGLRQRFWKASKRPPPAVQVAVDSWSGSGRPLAFKYRQSWSQ